MFKQNKNYETVNKKKKHFRQRTSSLDIACTKVDFRKPKEFSYLLLSIYTL